MRLPVAARAESQNSLGRAWKGPRKILSNKGRKLSHGARLPRKILSLKAGNLPKGTNTDVCLFLTSEPETHPLRGIITGQPPAVFLAQAL